MDYSGILLNFAGDHVLRLPFIQFQKYLTDEAQIISLCSSFSFSLSSAFISLDKKCHFLVHVFPPQGAAALGSLNLFLYTNGVGIISRRADSHDEIKEIFQGRWNLV
ncbi:MAG: hypothetical protein IJH81_08175 [Lachnospiraceae bacterium]|nr:hypothetical protein [Lachnospiraceae bacterium]